MFAKEAYIVHEILQIAGKLMVFRQHSGYNVVGDRLECDHACPGTGSPLKILLSWPSHLIFVIVYDKAFKFIAAL